MSSDQPEEFPRPKRVRMSDLNNFVVSNETFILRARPVLSHLPADVWLLILSHFPKLSKREIMKEPGFAFSLPPRYGERFDAFRALSQTCRTLRATFLPLVWEHVEACIWSNPNYTVDYYISYVLGRQCYGLLKYSELASQVKTLSVSLLDCSEKPVLRQLARCLASLPNLSTLHIVSCTHQRADLEKVFKNKVYPSIENLVLPANVYPIVSCCFALRDVHVRPCHNDGPVHCWQQLILGLAANCPYVEIITGLTLTESQRDAIQRETQGSPYAARVQEMLVLQSA